eukprot:gb/GECG01005211.1/.p1 GENE.gb/GECG01005211.1/~~gb/GECG01005211.1/.p1  ORF type:complete len:155 (+),score=17.71 gb/GECG01005211.1/:1-465(+)
MWNIKIGKYTVKGVPDGIILPWSQMDVDPGSQIRAAVDFKVKFDGSNMAQRINQAMGMFIAANALSFHEVIVVFTDMNGANEIYRANQTNVGVIERLEGLTYGGMVTILSRFLREESTPELITKWDESTIRGPANEKAGRIQFKSISRTLQTQV